MLESLLEILLLKHVCFWALQNHWPLCPIVRWERDTLCSSHLIVEALITIDWPPPASTRPKEEESYPGYMVLPPLNLSGQTLI